MKTHTIYDHPLKKGQRFEYVDPSELGDTPNGWKQVVFSEDGQAYVWDKGLSSPYVYKVIRSACLELDGNFWLHVSISKWKTGKNLPEKSITFAELKWLKDTFIGKDKIAIQVFPVESNFVDILNVYHLWHCITGNPVPDFTQGIGSI